MKKKISVGYTALDVKESLRNKRQKECIIYLEKMTGWLTMIVVLLLTGKDIKSQRTKQNKSYHIFQVFLIPLSFIRFKPSLDDDMYIVNTRLT